MTNEEIQANLTSMSELAHAERYPSRVCERHARERAITSRPPTSVPQTTQRPMTRIRALNEWIKIYAAAHNDTYLDYFSAMVDPSGVMQEDLTADDLHPNTKGYAIMGPLAEAAIARALK